MSETRETLDAAPAAAAAQAVAVVGATSPDDGNWRRRAASLVRICEAGAWSVDIETAYSAICETILEVMGCTSAYLHLLTAEGDSMVRYGTGPERDTQTSEWGTHLPMGVGRVSQIFDRREPIIMDYTHPHAKDRVPDSAREAGYRSAISVPVVSGGEVYGMLTLSYMRSIDWADQDIEYLEEIGRVVGVAVNRIRTTKNSSELALLEERQRLSSEIHDNVSHHLGALSLCAAATLESYDEGDHDQVKAGLDKLEAICGQTMRVFRDEMLSLRVPLQRTDEWLQGVARILKNFEAEWGIATRLEEDIAHKPLSLNLQSALQLTRILNECLSNTLRHAQASQITVRLYEDGRVVRMSVEDNGKGFDVNGVAPERLGLKIMRERAATTGGGLSIRSGCRGTMVTVEVPRIGGVERLRGV